MKKLHKRLSCAVLAAVMTMGLLPAGVFAEQMSGDGSVMGVSGDLISIELPTQTGLLNFRIDPNHLVALASGEEEFTVSDTASVLFANYNSDGEVTSYTNTTDTINVKNTGYYDVDLSLSAKVENLYAVDDNDAMIDVDNDSEADYPIALTSANKFTDQPAIEMKVNGKLSNAATKSATATITGQGATADDVTKLKTLTIPANRNAVQAVYDSQTGKYTYQKTEAAQEENYNGFNSADYTLTAIANEYADWTDVSSAKPKVTFVWTAEKRAADIVETVDWDINGGTRSDFEFDFASVDRGYDDAGSANIGITGQILAAALKTGTEITPQNIGGISDESQIGLVDMDTTTKTKIVFDKTISELANAINGDSVTFTGVLAYTDTSDAEISKSFKLTVHVVDSALMTRTAVFDYAAIDAGDDSGDVTISLTDLEDADTTGSNITASEVDSTPNFTLVNVTDDSQVDMKLVSGSLKIAKADIEKAIEENSTALNDTLVSKAVISYTNKNGSLAERTLKVTITVKDTAQGISLTYSMGTPADMTTAAAVNSLVTDANSTTPAYAVTAAKINGQAVSATDGVAIATDGKITVKKEVMAEGFDGGHTIESGETTVVRAKVTYNNNETTPVSKTVYVKITMTAGT